MTANSDIETSSIDVSTIEQNYFPDSTETVSDELHEGRFHVPESIKQKEIWIVYRIEEEGGERKKVPKAPKFHYKDDALFNHSPTNTKYATTFGEALDFVRTSREEFGDEHGADGVGLIINEETDIVGIDFDKCYDSASSTVEEWALNVVETLDSFTEVSPSGTGLHTLVFGELDEEYQNKNDDLGFEVYDEERFFTFTGRHVEETPTEIKERTDLVQKAQRAHMEEADSNETIDGKELGQEIDESVREDAKEFGSKEQRLVSKAKQCDEDFKALYEGNIPAKYHGDHSRADMALASKLAYWCKGDIQMMDAVFRDSGLMRDKWDRKLGSTTYGRYTLRKACRKNTGRYSGSW